MSYLGVKFNNTIRKIAGMAIMDVAFSNTSANGVQNKVVKAKFDEVESVLTDKVKYKDVTISATASGWTNTPTGIDISKYDVIGWGFNYTDDYYYANANGKGPSLSYNKTTNNLVVYNGYGGAIALSVRVIYTAK